MKVVFCLLLLVSVALCLNYHVSQEDIETLNSRIKSWQAGINENFIGWSRPEIKHLFGWRSEMERKLPAGTFINITEEAIPTSFDSGANWPKCTTINTIYNQARCGSCWAFGGVEAAADRFCISSGGKFNQPLSFAEVVECSSEADGCDGGSASATWDYINSPGLNTAACYPYFVPTCPAAQQPCLNFVETPSCWSNNTCADGSSWSTVYQVSSVFGLNSVADAQKEIMTNGPIEACFSVYADFVNYKSGVYIYDGTSEYLGGHCIKMTGWGVENGVPYWECHNQWTTYWGNQGTFKIRQGTDECGIEDSMVAGTPVINF